MAAILEHFQRGLELRVKGKWRDAIGEFDAALQLNTSHALAHAERGFSYGELGQPDQAVADLERAKALTDDRNFIADLEAAIKELREPAEHTAPGNFGWLWWVVLFLITFVLPIWGLLVIGI